MKIFVHEYVSGGGCCDKKIPHDLLIEGYAMLNAVLDDLHNLPERPYLVTSLDIRFANLKLTADEVVPVDRGQFDQIFSGLVDKNDAVLLIAPEMEGILAELSEMVIQKGKLLLGASPQAVRITTDKYQTYQILSQHGLPVPKTVPASYRQNKLANFRDLPYPLVLKPRDGVGCSGIFIVHTQDELQQVCRQIGDQPYLVQEYIAGTPASVSLISNGRQITPLSLNAQKIQSSFRMEYLGGTVPLSHPLQDLALFTARQACSTISGLKGYLGVDMVLTEKAAIIMEINPRLTTSYLGLKQVAGRNIAGLILQACCSDKPLEPFSLIGQVDFSIQELKTLLSR
ncbi:MAG: ATP-grasp domain-containing protein [Clostridia bacterium]|nr:ATP-grasp domain-containing protein [Clostridia bacterium]